MTKANYTKRMGVRSRGKRRLMPRDLAVLRFIAEMQPVTTSMICIHFKISADIGRRICRKLRDYTLIKVWVECLEQENRYTLRPTGLELLIEQYGIEKETLHVPRRLLKGLAHHDGSVRFFIALSAALEHRNEKTPFWDIASQSTVGLEAFILERTIRRRLGNVTSAQVPDAIAVLRQTPQKQVAFSIEIDIGGESASYLTKNKAVPYGQFHEARTPLWGCSSWRVVCLVPTMRRLHRLVAAFYEAGCLPEGLWFFAVSAKLTPENVLTDAPWQTLTVAADKARLVARSPFPVLTEPIITNRHHGRDGLGVKNSSKFNYIDDTPLSCFPVRYGGKQRHE